MGIFDTTTLFSLGAAFGIGIAANYLYDHIKGRISKSKSYEVEIKTVSGESRRIKLPKKNFDEKLEDIIKEITEVLVENK